MWILFKAFIKKHLFMCIGGVVGLLAAVLFITVGFWQTLLILALVTAGVLLGARLDRVSGVTDALNKWLPFVPGDEDD